MQLDLATIASYNYVYNDVATYFLTGTFYRLQLCFNHAFVFARDYLTVLQMLRIKWNKRDTPFEVVPSHAIYKMAAH